MSAAIMDEDVLDAVGIAVHQVASGGLKGHQAPSGTQGGGNALIVALGARAVHADAGGRSCVAIMNKDVRGVVGIARHQVGGAGLKGHEAPSSTQGWQEAATVRLGARTVHTDAGGRARAAIMDEDVVGVVGIARHQIGGDSVEGQTSS
jgi:hypothetical protein